MITSRRSFIRGLASLVAAPAIVRASSLMHINALELEPVLTPLRNDVPTQTFLEIDDMLKAMWDKYRIEPTVVYVHPDYHPYLEELAKREC